MVAVHRQSSIVNGQYKFTCDERDEMDDLTQKLNSTSHACMLQVERQLEEKKQQKSMPVGW